MPEAYNLSMGAAAYKDLMVRFDKLQTDEQWQFVVALMQRLSERPKASVLDFKPTQSKRATSDAQKRVQQLRKEWQD